MKTLKLAAALILPLALALPASAQNVTVTGSNGGSIQKSRDCVRNPGLAQCSTSTTVTGANGQTATKERARTTQAGVSSTVVTRTGANGQSNTRGRVVTVSP